MLRQQVLFRHLEQEQQDFVARTMVVVEFKSGDVIYRQGQNGDVFYIIDHGNVECLEFTSCPSDEKPLHTYGPGNTFGELSIMHESPRPYSFRAITDCRLYALDRRVS